MQFIKTQPNFLDFSNGKILRKLNELPVRIWSFNSFYLVSLFKFSCQNYCIMYNYPEVLFYMNYYFRSSASRSLIRFPHVTPTPRKLPSKVISSSFFTDIIALARWTAKQVPGAGSESVAVIEAASLFMIILSIKGWEGSGTICSFYFW